MKKKEYKFLEDKMQELVMGNIITESEFNNAKEYFSSNCMRDNKPIGMIFSAIGVLLIALSIITIFAINWNGIPKDFKIIVSMVPLLITSFMLFYYMKSEDKKLNLYTSIFAPISIVATNSLISQIFHIQSDIYEVIFISLLSFMPIMLILRSNISIIIYGVGTILYSISANEILPSSLYSILNSIIVSMPLIVYNIINYNKNKSDAKNIILWVINIILITTFMLYKNILSGSSILIYIYLIYLLSKVLFGKENKFCRMYTALFTTLMLITCISSEISSFIEYIQPHIDTILITIAIWCLVFISKFYEDIKDILILIFILFIEILKVDMNIVFILINIITILYGILTIVAGSREKSSRNIRKGIGILILIILFRFISSELSFGQKSIIFLITGVSFIIASNMLDKKIGVKDNEKNVNG